MAEYRQICGCRATFDNVDSVSFNKRDMFVEGCSCSFFMLSSPNMKKQYVFVFSPVLAHERMFFPKVCLFGTCASRHSLHSFFFNLTVENQVFGRFFVLFGQGFVCPKRGEHLTVLLGKNQIKQTKLHSDKQAFFCLGRFSVELSEQRKRGNGKPTAAARRPDGHHSLLSASQRKYPAMRLS